MYPTRFDSLYEKIPRYLNTTTGFLSEVDCRVVETVDELKKASHLVYKEYVKRGYMRPNASRSRFSMYHALPQTTTFIVTHPRTGIIGTITLIQDSLLGLPMDEAYTGELDKLRRQGQRLVEVSMLAFDSAVLGQLKLTFFSMPQLFLALRLFKPMFDYVRRCTDVTELVACFNPKHAVLHDFLRLIPFGQVKPYSLVGGHPAVARHLNIADNYRKIYSDSVMHYFYTDCAGPESFQRKLTFSSEDLYELFGRTGIFSSMSPTEAINIQNAYPMHDLTDLFNEQPIRIPS